MIKSIIKYTLVFLLGAAFMVSNQNVYEASKGVVDGLDSFVHNITNKETQDPDPDKDE